MSSMLVIRHGQASFGAANYDVLSALGVEQSKRLGTKLAALHPNLDAIYTGPARRHRDTTEHAITGADRVGTTWPAPTIDVDLDEYPVFELAKVLRATAPTDPEARSAYYIEASKRWSRGELECGDLESFASFESRVNRCVQRIIDAHPRGSAVAVFTSGGPVSIILKRALSITPEKTIDMAWLVANASFSEFRYSGDRFSLSTFNRIGHLDSDEGLLTYR